MGRSATTRCSHFAYFLFVNVFITYADTHLHIMKCRGPDSSCQKVLSVKTHFKSLESMSKKNSLSC